MAIALPFRIRSQSTGESLDRRQEGIVTMITLRLSGLVLWGSVIAFMISPASMAWSSLPLGAPVRWSGLMLAVVTALLLLWTLLSLGPNLTDTVVTRQSHTLVTRGPYQWVRHPFYDCMVLFMVATATDDGELVRARDRGGVFRHSGGAVAHRGRETARAVRRAVPRLPGADGTLFAENVLGVHVPAA